MYRCTAPGSFPAALSARSRSSMRRMSSIRSYSARTWPASGADLKLVIIPLRVSRSISLRQIGREHSLLGHVDHALLREFLEPLLPQLDTQTRLLGACEGDIRRQLQMLVDPDGA